MPLRQIDHLILGAGAAAATAAATLRLEDADCSIMILSVDDSPPYYRPELSKLYLLGSASNGQILLHPAGFYEDQRIELGLSAAAVALVPPPRSSLHRPANASIMECCSSQPVPCRNVLP